VFLTPEHCERRKRGPVLEQEHEACNVRETRKTGRTSDVRGQSESFWYDVDDTSHHSWDQLYSSETHWLGNDGSVRQYSYNFWRRLATLQRCEADCNAVRYTAKIYNNIGGSLHREDPASRRTHEEESLNRDLFLFLWMPFLLIIIKYVNWWLLGERLALGVMGGSIINKFA